MFEPFPDLFSRKDSAHTFPPVSRTVCCFAFNTIHRIILDVNKSWESLKYLKTSSKYLQKAAAAEVTPPQQPLFQAQMNINNTLLPFSIRALQRLTVIMHLSLIPVDQFLSLFYIGQFYNSTSTRPSASSQKASMIPCTRICSP